MSAMSNGHEPAPHLQYPILYVDDEADNLDAFRFNFRRVFHLEVAQSGAEGLEILRRVPVAVIITDQRMPEMTGTEFLAAARAARPDAIGIILTAYRDESVLIEAIKLGHVYRYIQKPWDRADLEAVVSQALERYHLRLENERLAAQLRQYAGYLEEERHGAFDFGQIVGTAPSLAKVLKQIEQVAPTSSTVLLRGETGTGKELLAHAIHINSPREGKPLVKVNCAALAPGVLESELFGHEKGAFTGAISRRIGRFELADGGTLFLRRGGGPAGRGADPPAAGAAGAGVRTHRGPRDGQGGRAARLRHQPEPGGAHRPGDLPPRPLLPAQRLPGAHPAAARAQGGHPAPGAPLHPQVRSHHRQADRGPLVRGPGEARAVRLARQRPGARERGGARDHPLHGTAIRDEDLDFGPVSVLPSESITPRVTAGIQTGADGRPLDERSRSRSGRGSSAPWKRPAATWPRPPGPWVSTGRRSTTACGSTRWTTCWRGGRGQARPEARAWRPGSVHPGVGARVRQDDPDLGAGAHRSLVAVGDRERDRGGSIQGGRHVEPGELQGRRTAHGLEGDVEGPAEAHTPGQVSGGPAPSEVLSQVSGWSISSQDRRPSRVMVVDSRRSRTAG